MKILVLGSNGQLGQCLKNELHSHDLDVFFSSREELDISKFEQSSKIIKDIQPNVVINASGYTKVDESELYDSMADIINNFAVLNIAETCKEINSSLIHISSDYVFDGSLSRPYTEQDITKPISAYGMSKLNGELSIKNSLCKHFIIRTSWAFSHYGNNFLKTMLKHGELNNELCIVDDQIGCPTYMPDLAMAIKELILHKSFFELNSEVFHFSGDKECSWFDFANEIFTQASLFGFKTPNKILPVRSSQYESSATRPPYSSLDCSKIKCMLDISPSDWRLGVKDALKKLS